jgi:plastocyanin
MLHLLFALLLFVGYSSPTQPHYIQQQNIQNGGIRGMVELPAVSDRAQNRFRGRVYRNRTNTEPQQQSASTSNPVTDVIISIHPTSYSLNAPPLEEPVQIIQRDATFIPNVTPVTVGSVVQFVNDDSFFHNVFSLTPGARFNIGRRPKGDVYSKEIPKLEWKVAGLGPINLYCDIHSQMSAVILSLDTPYFTRVNADGSYQMADLPDGVYELRAFHPKFDLITKTITIQIGKVLEMNISFS